MFGILLSSPSAHQFVPESTINMTTVTEVQSTSARLFAGTWRLLVSVITTLHCVAIIFHRQLWYRVLSLHVFTKIKIQASSSSPRLPLCQISFLLRLPLPRWNAEKNCVLSHSLNHSPSLFDSLGTEALALWNNSTSCPVYKANKQDSVTCPVSSLSGHQKIHIYNSLKASK